jgi:hypothetical protein
MIAQHHEPAGGTLTVDRVIDGHTPGSLQDIYHMQGPETGLTYRVEDAGHLVVVQSNRTESHTVVYPPGCWSKLKTTEPTSRTQEVQT